MADPDLREAWRPISDEQKDGEVYLLFKPDQPRSGESLFAGYWSDLSCLRGWVSVAGAYAIEGVTHYMPLPAPPTPNKDTV